MKKILLSVLISLTAFVALPLSASAAPINPGVTIVTGTVTKDGNPANPVKGAVVNVFCKSHFKKDTTNAAGDYIVTFTVKQCPNGSKVNVFATKGSLGGSDSGHVIGFNTKLNVGVVNIALPEIGIITGSVALLGGGTAFWAIRRRKVEQV